MRSGLSALAIGLGLLLSVPMRANLTFNVSYSGAVQALPTFGEIQGAVQYVENEYSLLYSDPIVVNINIDVDNAISLGGSISQITQTSFTALRNALLADATTSADASFNSALPGTDPIGTTHEWDLTCANAKALNITPSGGTCTGVDGTFVFNSNNTYTFDPNNRQVPSAFDFIGVTEHEFSEIMGRIFGLGSTNFGFGSAVYIPFDLARFSAPGTRSFTNCQTSSVSGIYFSVDGGTTNGAGFNNGPVGDCSDLNGAILTDPFNAFTGSNQGHLINSADIQIMDVIGFDSTVPEPATFGLVGLALAGVGVLRRRLTRRK